MDITNLIESKIFNRQKEPPRKYIGASSIGNPCNRAIWYDYHGTPNAGYGIATQIAFDVGKRLEGLILEYLRDAGLKIQTDELMLSCEDDLVSEFKGHIDALWWRSDIDPVIIEIKTAKSSSFNRFVNSGLREWAEQYYAQIQSYMGMMSIQSAVLLALNKDSSELHHEWVEFDADYYSELRAKAFAISTVEEAPPKINKSPLFFRCRMCKFKDVCHV